MSQIPERKHSNQELADVRAKAAMQFNNNGIVNPYEGRVMNRPFVIFGYIVAFSPLLYLCFVLLQNKLMYEMLDLYIMLGGVIVACLIALFIFLTRNLSRHHASFIVIIAVLSSFSSFYLLNKDQSLKKEVKVLLGIEEAYETSSEADDIVNNRLLQLEKGVKTAEREANDIVTGPTSNKVNPVTELTPEEKAEYELFKQQEENRVIPLPEKENLGVEEVR